MECKKAWAELEREKNDVKRNIKSLMRYEPGTRVIDDLALADRVTNVRMAPQSYETAEDLATQKRMQAQVDLYGGKAASPVQPVAKSRTNDRSGERESHGSNHSKDHHPSS